MPKSFEQHVKFLENAQNDFLNSTIDLSTFKKKLEALQGEITSTNPQLPRANDLYSSFSSFFYRREKDYYSSVVNTAGLKLNEVPTENSDALSKKTLLAIISNNDTLLTNLLRNNSSLISEISDHRSLINLTVELQSTHSFNILLDHGFDPMITPASDHVISPIALAARTQGEDFIKSYCQKISKKFGPEKLKNLVNELDLNKDNALGHALHGRSYLSTITLLFNDYGLDIAYNLERNTKTAIQNRHSRTLDFLLKENKPNLKNDLFITLSDYAKKEKNSIAQNILASHCSDEEILSKINTIINSHPNIDLDIFEICKRGSLQDFEILIENHKNDDSEISNINARDRQGSTPLFYAITGNGYDSLITKLLDHGADITNLTDPARFFGPQEHMKYPRQESMDALTLCIRTKQPKTLGTILKHPVMGLHHDGASEVIPDLQYRYGRGFLFSDLSLNKAVEEMVSQRYLNAKVIKSFLENISPERLENLNEETMISLKKKALELVPKTVEERTKSLEANHKFRNIENILRNKEIEKQTNNPEIAKETTPLLREATETEKPNASIYARVYNSLVGCFNSIQR